MSHLFYQTFSSPFDYYTIVWKETSTTLKIQRIFLSNTEKKSEIRAFDDFEALKSGSLPRIRKLNEDIQNFFNGGIVQFQLNLLDFSICHEFQSRVLLAENEIPRGYISTYKRIANHLGIENGARAIGNALANNPFPIIIPCHRAIKSNGELGGFQGGISMKKGLLRLEGIEVLPNGRAQMVHVFY